jgi:hypothetical protein
MSVGSQLLVDGTIDVGVDNDACAGGGGTEKKREERGIRALPRVPTIEDAPKMTILSGGLYLAENCFPVFRYLSSAHLAKLQRLAFPRDFTQFQQQKKSIGISDWLFLCGHSNHLCPFP